MFVSDLKKIPHVYYINHPMPMIQRIMSRRFSERNSVYNYRGLPDCILHPKSNYISRFRAPRSSTLGSNYLELPTM